MPDLTDVIKFGEWLPDQPSLGNAGANRAENIISSANNYLPFDDIDGVGTATDTTPKGAISLADKDRNVEFFVGDQAKLYRAIGTALSDVSLSGGYNTLEDGFWSSRNGIYPARTRRRS